jgi:hypothetical protein
MTAPVVQSVTFDKQSYNPGDLITVTVQGTAGSQVGTRNVTGTGTFTDSASGQTGMFTGTLTITTAVEDTTTASFSDNDTVTPARAYTLVPGSLSQTPAGVVTAKFTATA